MQRLFVFFLLLVFVSLLSACGQTGKLYLPEGERVRPFNG